MAETISVLIVDKSDDTRDSIKEQLKPARNFTVVGDAKGRSEGIGIAERLKPDIILLDLNGGEPEGIETIRVISQRLPWTSVVVMADIMDQGIMKRSMLAGAKEFLAKPPDGKVLLETLAEVYDEGIRRKEGLMGFVESVNIQEKEGKVIVVCSTKGGVGKTTVATNLAIDLHRLSGEPVVLLDLDLQFGDIPLFLDIVPRFTIGDAIQELKDKKSGLAEGHMCKHDSGIHVLAAPSRPEYADYVNGSHVQSILKDLQRKYSYIIVDTPPSFGETVLSAMDAASHILLITNLEITTIRGTKLALEIMQSLNYRDDKIKVLLNRATEQWGISSKESKETLGRDFWEVIPSDSRVVGSSINQGVPFVMGQPRAEVSKSIRSLSYKINNGGLESPRRLKRVFLNKAR
ncbi:MAG: AAA family ATPase [Bacillota bacterium]|nr:AAA family ATPase [Bacillota bacterium]MDD3298226.1 AAA family ATPase [Bacillota bacterium]MDD3850661.1 AAA family ATPase [Bacillota bacterium]MDD4707789.1 AAA family ATPase [Bacillota bacterium]